MSIMSSRRGNYKSPYANVYYFPSIMELLGGMILWNFINYNFMSFIKFILEPPMNVLPNATLSEKFTRAIIFLDNEG